MAEQATGDLKITTGKVKVDTIEEATADAGMTVETVPIKDGKVDGRDLSIDGAKLDLIGASADKTSDNTCDTPGGAGTDTTAIHGNVAGEIHAIADIAPTALDEIVIEDQSDSWNKKRTQLGDISDVIKRNLGLFLVPADTAVAVLDGLDGIPIPAELNGYNISDVLATVDDKGVDDHTDIQVRRRRAGAEVDVLSVKVTIGDEMFANDGTIDEANDDLATGDILYVDVDAVHSTSAPNGLSVVISVTKP